METKEQIINFEEQGDIFITRYNFEVSENIGDEIYKKEPCLVDKKIQHKTSVLQKQQPKVVKNNYPGSTKNIPKNFSRALKAYIKRNYLAEVQEVHEVRILMKAENDKAVRDTLTKFINGSVGKQIAKEFFGSCGWALELIQGNKASVDQFFQYNQEWY